MSYKPVVTINHDTIPSREKEAMKFFKRGSQDIIRSETKVTTEETVKTLQAIAHELETTKNRLANLVEALKKEKRSLR